MELDFSSDVIEKLLLKRALSDKNWLSVLNNIYDKRWFKVQYVGMIVRLVLNYYKKYSSIPNTAIIHALVKKQIEKSPDSTIKLADVQQLLSEVQNLELNLPESAIRANLEGFVKKNAFYNSLYDNAELLDKNADGYEQVVEKCLTNFENVQKILFSDTDLGTDYFNPKDVEKHWDFINNPEAKIKTGWDSLDEYTNGGFLKDGKMLGLIMAQAGLGKSVFLSNFAVNCLKQNLSVVVISLEMSEDVYNCRFDAHISHTDVNKLKDNETTARERILSFYNEHPKSRLYVKEYPPRSIRSQDIQNYLENLQNAGKRFDVVIIDYLNLVLPNHRSDSMYKDGQAVSEELRGLSYIFKCPFISAVQSNSEGMNSESIDMQNVAESRGIVHTADFLAALYQKEDDRENGIINMRVLKNRLGGRVGKISNFRLNPESLVVNDVTFDNIYLMSEDDENHGNLSTTMSGISEDIEVDVNGL